MSKYVGCMFCFKDSIVPVVATQCPHCKEERLVFVADTDEPITVVTTIESLELTIRDLEKEVAELSSDKEETIWRVSTEDFTSIMDSDYPELSSGDKKNLVDLARRKFDMDGWEEQVRDFIESHMDLGIPNYIFRTELMPNQVYMLVEPKSGNIVISTPWHMVPDEVLQHGDRAIKRHLINQVL